MAPQASTSLQTFDESANRSDGPPLSTPGNVAFAFEELHGDGIQAVTLAGRGRAVREDVAEMTVASRAADLRPDHSVAHVADLADMLRVIRLGEARPAGAGF